MLPVMAALLLGWGGMTIQAQGFSATKKKLNFTAESYGLGIDNFGMLDTTGKEITDIKNIHYGDRITLAFYNVSNYQVIQDLAHLRLTMSIVNLTDNVLLVASETLLDEAITAEKLKNEYVSCYFTVSDGFVKGKSYLVKAHLWDIKGGQACDLVWKFKANFPPPRGK